MNSSRRRLTTLFVGLLAIQSGLVSLPVLAHETDCPRCKLKVVQDTETQDNEVALRYGRKRIEYRCVGCAVADVERGIYKDSDITVLAPSETKGKPIPVTRAASKWQAPAGTVFVGENAGHENCHKTFRAFSSQAAFDTYIKKHAELKNAKPLTVEQMVQAAGK
jgi:hypothetical protein